MKNLILAAMAIFFGLALSGCAAHPIGGGLAGEQTLDLGGKVTLKLVLIPAGKFMMGRPENENVRDTEAIQHEVTISKPFYMGATHVTVDQFAAFVRDTGYKTDAEKDGSSLGFQIKDGQLDFKEVKGCSWRKPSFQQKGNDPVVQVSWYDAKAFCDWLSKKSGKTVALPSEAQWEYACRAGTTTAYPWGDNPDDGKGWANCGDQSLRKMLPNESGVVSIDGSRQAPGRTRRPMTPTFFNWDDGYAFTSPVGSFKPNAFGLYDMIGNAWEWCQDRYGDYPKRPATDPTGADAGGQRVLRGGSWNGNPWNCRSACRDEDQPDSRTDRIGFRVAVIAG